MNNSRIELQEPEHDCLSWRWRVMLGNNTVGSGMADDEDEARSLAQSWLVAYQPDDEYGCCGD